MVDRRSEHLLRRHISDGPHRSAFELVVALGDEGIITSDRDDNVRISAHCYNTAEDVDTVLAALRRHRKLLA